MLTYAKGWDEEKVVARIRKRNGFTQCRGGLGISTSACAYRSLEGKCCYVGAFIPDDEYHADIENSTVDKLLREHGEYLQHMPFVESLEGEYEDGLFGAFQTLHDNGQTYNAVTGHYESHSPEQMEHDLRSWLKMNVQ